jgi:hypothetical protein
MGVPEGRSDVELLKKPYVKCCGSPEGMGGRVGVGEGVRVAVGETAAALPLRAGTG